MKGLDAKSFFRATAKQNPGIALSGFTASGGMAVAGDATNKITNCTAQYRSINAQYQNTFKTLSGSSLSDIAKVVQSGVADNSQKLGFTGGRVIIYWYRE